MWPFFCAALWRFAVLDRPCLLGVAHVVVLPCLLPAAGFDLMFRWLRICVCEVYSSVVLFLYGSLLSMVSLSIMCYPCSATVQKC